jgi:hypothetical protein
MIDTERVFAYRALSFSRKDPAALPGFDENNWAAQSMVKDRDWRDMIEEFKAVRKATEALFYSFTDEQLLYSGTASNNSLNVLATGYICAGHVNHHINILKERYLNDKAPV